MKKNNVNQKKGAAHAGIGKIVLWIVLLLVAVIQIFPLIWLLDFSLASSTEMFTNGLLILPEKIQWGNYVTAFVDGHFLQYLKNSIIINGLAVFFVLLISIMAAYACRRMRWKLSGLVKTILLLGMMIPIHATLLPNYKIYNTLGLTDTIWALLIPYVAFSLPAGTVLNDRIYRFDSVGDGGGGGHGRLRNLPDRIPDYHTDVKTVDCDSGDHDLLK